MGSEGPSGSGLPRFPVEGAYEGYQSPVPTAISVSYPKGILRA